MYLMCQLFILFLIQVSLVPVVEQQDEVENVGPALSAPFTVRIPRFVLVFS